MVTSAGSSIPLSGWWRRAGGWLLDAVIVEGVLLVINVVVGSVFYSGLSAFVSIHHLPTAPSAVRIAVNLLGVMIGLAYQIILLSRRGQTVGMMAVGVVAIDREGTTLTRQQVWKRTIVLFLFVNLWIEIAFFIDLASHSSGQHHAPGWGLVTLIGVVMALVTYLWPLGSPLNQTLQDKFANSVVVKAGPGSYPS
jgi:uncharacterized RDD family membrane protein YckC